MAASKLILTDENTFKIGNIKSSILPQLMLFGCSFAETSFRKVSGFY